MLQSRYNLLLDGLDIQGVTSIHKENALKAFLEAANQAINQRNWYAALVLSLTLPDICGWLENPGQPSTKRYVDWCRRYLQPKYTSHIGAEREEHIFLTAEDTYALRCALLHEGVDDITRQRVQSVLMHFRFVEPPDSGRIHCNSWNDVILQLQVDIFCKDIVEGVERWTQDVLESSATIKERMKSMLLIYNSRDFQTIFG